MLETHHNKGVERLEAFVAQFPDWRRLTPADLKRYGMRFTEGWELPCICEDPSTCIRILVDCEFPFKSPRIAVFPFPPVLTWPNLEGHGLLCLRAEGTPSSTEQIESDAIKLLSDARDLVNGWYSKTGLERFEDEFQSYWSYWRQKNEYFLSLCVIDGASRWVWAIRYRRFFIVADDQKTLKSWIANYFTKDLNVTIDPIPLIRLPKPPRPEEYPKTVANLFSLLASETESLRMLQELITSNPDKPKGVMLSFPGRRGFGFAGLILPPYDKEIINGFRKERMPVQVLRKRYSLHTIIGASVARCDPCWVHGRDQNSDTATLANKTVVLLGVGSLGSGVSEILAKIGIGKLVLVDPEPMATENACRHTLGVCSLSSMKASEQAKNLSKRFPHLQFEAHCERWELFCLNNPSVLTSADLVISTIGIWSAESSLNAHARASEQFPPILFGWLEEHAVAGHAVTFFGDKGCLRCMTDDTGHTRIPVTKWPDGGTLKQVPMCGGLFQPYGATELTFTQGLVADLATDILLSRTNSSTHRVWIGPKKLLEPGKGEWHPQWIANHGHPGDGGKILNLAIKDDVTCTICGESR